MQEGLMGGALWGRSWAELLTTQEAGKQSLWGKGPEGVPGPSEAQEGFAVPLGCQPLDSETCHLSIEDQGGKIHHT